MAAQPLHLGWYNPVRVHWGAGSFQSLSANGPVVVLADRAALSYEDETGLVERLGSQCKAWSWFRGGLASVALAQTLCDELWPAMQDPQTTIIAIGGGSTLDFAKVLRYRMGNSMLAAECWRRNTLPEGTQRHPVALVPTTAGTGSEVTRWATLWDTLVAEPVKLSWAPRDGFAEQAYVDPALTLSCPVRLTRDCALDTLAHALESLWNHNRTPVSDALALESARLVLSTLPALLQQPRDLGGRMALSHASLLAGLAMSQTQTALAHALSYELTLQEGIAHGEACAVWLPMVWELAVQAQAPCNAALARVFACSAAEGAEHLRAWLLKLDVHVRDLRDTSQGLALLDIEMRSARGRNFIASPSTLG
jgi:phosphonate metabolism-associated iron-containing alcohol dehydrogenase